MATLVLLVPPCQVALTKTVIERAVDPARTLTPAPEVELSEPSQAGATDQLKTAPERVRLALSAARAERATA